MIKIKNKVFKLFFIGTILGLAVIIPGMSGASLAFSMNIYNDILENISNIKTNTKQRLKFLCPIIIGAFVGLVIGIFILKVLLRRYPLETIYLFAGLILGGIPHFIKSNLKLEKKHYFIYSIFGFLLPLALVGLSFYTNVSRTLNLTITSVFIFTGLGMLIALIELLPGLSASSILISLGYFTPLVSSFSFIAISENKELLIIYTLIISGLLAGLFFSSKLINCLLKKYNMPILYLMTGMSISSFVTMLYNIETKSIMDSIPKEIIISKLLLSSLFLILGFLISYIPTCKKSVKK